MRSRHQSIPNLVLALVLIANLGACDAEVRETAGIQVQIEDSAGVRIVEYPGTPNTEAAFQFPPGPLYRHGTNPGDYAFQGIDRGGLFPDGSAVISDPFNEELVVLSPDGTTHEVLASGGEGPGDISLVMGLFAAGTGQCPGGRPQPGPRDPSSPAVRSPAQWTSGAPGWPWRQGNRFFGPTADGHEFVHVRFCRGVAGGAHGPVRHGDRNPRHDCVLRSSCRAPRRTSGGARSERIRQRYRRRRSVRLHSVRQTGDHLATAGRHRNADRPMAGRAGSADGGVAGQVSRQGSGRAIRWPTPARRMPTSRG